MNGFKKISEKRNLEFEEILKEIEIVAEADYVNKITPLLNYIKENNLNKVQSLKAIYDFLINYCDIDDNYLNNAVSGGYVTPIQYVYKNYPLNHLVSSVTKYGVILNGKGVCAGFSDAFADISSRVGIFVEIVSGVHIGFKHKWILTLIDGLPYHIDVFDGISNKRSNVNPYVSFLQSTDSIIKTGKYKDFLNSQNLATERLKASNSKFKVVSRTDIDELNPEFKVVSRTDIDNQDSLIDNTKFR